MIELKKKIIEMEYPIITSYPHIALYLSLLQKHPNYKEWLFNNFVQLHTKKQYNQNYLHFYQPIQSIFFPLMERQYIDIGMMNRNNINIQQYCKTAIDDNWVVFLIIDTSCLAASGEEEGIYSPHEIVVFGYNVEENTFDIANFFQQGKFDYKKASFVEFENAFASQSKHLFGYSGLFGPQLLKMDPTIKYSFDIEYLLVLLKDYINSTNTSKRYKIIEEPLDATHVFGMDCYQEIQHYLESEQFFSVGRMLHVLSDHKLLMHLRIEYLYNTGILQQTELIELFKDVYNRSIVIRNMYLKYTMTRKVETLVSIKMKLDELMGVELENINKLVETLGQFREKTSVL
jgi:hypothetical protein